MLAAGLFMTAAGPARPSGGLAALLDYERRLRGRLADAGGGAFDLGFARELLAQGNELRMREKLAVYAWCDDLAVCARAHAADMAARGYFAHESPEGFAQFVRAGLLARNLCGETAENLAWRECASGSTPADIETLWEDSPGHRRNLLRSDYTSAGYGAVRVGDRVYAAGVYAKDAVRLARPLALRVQGAEDLSQVIIGASPHIERYAWTAPFEDPSWSTSPKQGVPRLQAGAWQLRPLQPLGGRSFSVLSGPLFFVG